MADALVCWQGDRADQRALEQQPDWSGLKGIDGLWPLLAQSHGTLTAVEAAHGQRLRASASRHCTSASAWWRLVWQPRASVPVMWWRSSPRTGLAGWRWIKA